MHITIKGFSSGKTVLLDCCFYKNKSIKSCFTSFENLDQKESLSLVLVHLLLTWVKLHILTKVHLNSAEMTIVLAIVVKILCRVSLLVDH